MASSYGKRTWFHQMVGIISLLAMVACYLMIDHKPCQAPLLPREELSRWKLPKPLTGTEISTKSLRQKNQTQLAIEIEQFIQNYYDTLQMFHVATGCWSIVIVILGMINIVPKHEDFKVMTILLLVLIMGFAALFSFYTAFLAFHKPCRSLTNGDKFQVTRYNLRNLFRHQQQQLQQQQQQQKHNHHNGLSSQRNRSINSADESPMLTPTLKTNQPTKPNIHRIITTTTTTVPTTRTRTTTTAKPLPRPEDLVYMLEFRSIKDKRPVNVFEDEDEIMIRITLINTGVGFILLCSDFLFFFDSRQHLIEWRN